MIKAVLVLVLSFNSIRCGDGHLEAFIVGGEFSYIKQFPHSVCLGISYCDERWLCGSSVLNQRILLTAAHCINDCETPSSDIIIHYGSAYLLKANTMPASKIIVHKGYVEGFQFCDIGLVMMPKSLTLGVNVRRVAIFPLVDTPYNEEAAFAGWGFVDVSICLNFTILCIFFLVI